MCYFSSMRAPAVLASILATTIQAKPLANIKWSDYESSVAIKLSKKNLETVCSGVFIKPHIVLTTAHCLVDLKSAEISNEKVLNWKSHKIKAHHWLIHPEYKGNFIGESTDVGLIFLEQSITQKVHFPVLAPSNNLQPFKRIGFGNRFGDNRRTLVVSDFDQFAGDYIRVRDQYGYPGDSGGPIYQAYENELKLVGLHTGRELSNFGYPLNISYVQPLFKPEILNWIEKEVKE